MADETSAGAILHRWPEPAEGGAGPLYLLLHYPAGHWDFPKGHVEPGETEEQALMREAEEETGIPPERLKILPDFREGNGYYYTRSGRVVSKVVYYYIVLTDAVDVKLSDEHQGFAWLSINDAVARLSFPEIVEILKKAHARITARSRPAAP